MRPGSPRDCVADPVARTIVRANLLRRLAKMETATPRVGRFTVLEKLGEGAHGVVYAAFDPELDRRVALDRWLARGQQPEAILEVLIGAGQGLAEADARGLTHRDFKPSNVMVGRDGRARVTDFGLARGAVARIGRDVARR